MRHKPIGRLQPLERLESSGTPHINQKVISTYKAAAFGVRAFSGSGLEAGASFEGKGVEIAKPFDCRMEPRQRSRAYRHIKSLKQKAEKEEQRNVNNKLRFLGEATICREDDKRAEQSVGSGDYARRIVPVHPRGATSCRISMTCLACSASGLDEKELAIVVECLCRGLNDHLRQATFGKMGLKGPDNGVMVRLRLGMAGAAPNDRRSIAWRKIAGPTLTASPSTIPSSYTLSLSPGASQALDGPLKVLGRCQISEC